MLKWLIGLFLCIGLNLAYADTFTVVIDPGHGGKDVGAVSKYGNYEKHITLSVAKKLEDLIDLTPGMRALLTRNKDQYISLWNRTQYARRHKADVFISIHADAFTNSKAQGASVFVVSDKGATTAAARWLARRENRSDFATGVSVDDKSDHVASVLIDLTQTQTRKANLQLAQDLLRPLGRVTKLHGGYVEKAPFLVLKAPDIPSALVELGFLTHPAEARKLNTNAFQERLARALYTGIIRFAQHHGMKQPVRYLSYRVRKGDSLWHIARRFSMSWQVLKRQAGLSNTKLRIGQEIRVPISTILIR